MVLKRGNRKRKEKGKKKKVSLRKAVKAVAKIIYENLVKLPEEERERNIAAMERAVAKRLKKLRGKRGGK